MKKSKKILTIIVMIVFLLSIAGFTGCGKKDDRVQVVNGKKIFTVKMPTQTGFNEYFIAEDEGFFKEEGIQIEYTGVLKSGTSDVQTVITGDNDVFQGHPSTVAKAILAGAKIKIVAPGMVDNEKFIHMGYFVKDSSTIKSADDVKNRKIKIGVSSTNSCTDIIASEWARQHNIPKSNLEFVLMPDAQQEQALKQGLIDLTDLHPPFIKKIQNDGGARLLFSSYDVVKGPAGGSSIRGFSDKFIKEHPDVVKGFIRAIIKAHHWINTNQQQAIQIVAKRLNMKPENVNPFWYDETDYIQDEYIQTWLDLMIRNGVLQPGKIKSTDLYTNALNPYYKK